MTTPPPTPRTTIRTLRQAIRKGERVPFLTCYDATTALWLTRGGVTCLLVGDTAAQVILGHDSTLPATMPFMLEITAAVRRGAPQAFIVADMPFGSYQCGDDLAMKNAADFLKVGGADVVKLEVTAEHAPLVHRMSRAGIPVVAHLGSRPQQVRAVGGYRAEGRTRRDVDRIVDSAKLMLDQGAAVILLEAVPDEVSHQVVHAAMSTDPLTPVIGCGAGPSCHGHVVVLHDLLGLTDWHPPFVQPNTDVGARLQQSAAAWVKLVQSGEYLQHDHPYQLKDT